MIAAVPTIVWVALVAVVILAVVAAVVMLVRTALGRHEHAEPAYADDGPWPYAEQPAAARGRDPLGRLFPAMPRSARVVLDWILTIAGAVAIVLALKAWVVNPYRIPSS